MKRISYNLYTGLIALMLLFTSANVNARMDQEMDRGYGKKRGTKI